MIITKYYFRDAYGLVGRVIYEYRKEISAIALSTASRTAKKKE